MNWLVVLVTAALTGCGGPSPQQLLPSLREQVEQDDGAYNARMNQYGPPQMSPDGSVYTTIRYQRSVAVPWEQIKVEETGGHTTTHRAIVPKVIQPYIKSGPTAESCAAAPERPLAPQRQNATYEYNSVQKQWHESRSLLP